MPVAPSGTRLRLQGLPDITGQAAVWRADELARQAGATRPTGHAVLDAVLPGGGWPVGALVEVLQPQAGQGEWRLLLPALGASPRVRWCWSTRRTGPSCRLWRRRGWTPRAC
jgi:hypothetical protein